MDSAGTPTTSAYLSLADSFGYGCIGGFAAGIVLFVLPSLLGAHRRGEAMHIDRDNVVVVVLLILIFTLLAGFGTWLVGNIASPAMAIKVGFGVEGTIKGVFSGAEQATKTAND